MVYTDGYRDAERWRVMPETGQRVSVRGIALSGGALAFDRDRRLYGLGGTVLAEALQLGAWHYPAGTEVSLFTPRRLARATSARLAVQSYPRSRFACLRRAPGTRRLAVADAGRPGT